MVEKTFDVVALGELLIDFTENGFSRQDNPLFEANPGGAPCNVLAMLRKLGWSCAFAGKVGDDMFGQQLRAVVEEAGICGDYLVTDRNARTTLAFVKKLPKKAGVPPGLSAVWAAMLSGGDRRGVADALGGRRESS